MRCAIQERTDKFKDAVQQLTGFMIDMKNSTVPTAAQGSTDGAVVMKESTDIFVRSIYFTSEEVRDCCRMHGVLTRNTTHFRTSSISSTPRRRWI
jgi:hypothetical protein